MNRTFRPAAGPDANDDLVEALSPTLLDVDVATEGSRDRRREVVAGELLRALVDGEVSIGDIDRLVRHHDIVTPVERSQIYVGVYVYHYRTQGTRRKGPRVQVIRWATTSTVLATAADLDVATLEVGRVGPRRRGSLDRDEELATGCLAGETGRRVDHVSERGEVADDVIGRRRAHEGDARVYGGTDGDRAGRCRIRGARLARAGCVRPLPPRPRGRSPLMPPKKSPMTSSPTNLSTMPSLASTASEAMR